MLLCYPPDAAPMIGSITLTSLIQCLMSIYRSLQLAAQMWSARGRVGPVVFLFHISRVIYAKVGGAQTSFANRKSANLRTQLFFADLDFRQICKCLVFILPNISLKCSRSNLRTTFRFTDSFETELHEIS